MSDLTSQYIIAQEEHDYNKKYEEGTIVKHTIDDVTTAYIAKKNVPQFISILNENYWKKIASTNEGGTVDYDDLNNKPSINGVELAGHLDSSDLNIENLIKVNYAELKILRDQGRLVPGRQYRIIDYVCTTRQTNTLSENHIFDIIVRADSTDKLNEDSYAINNQGDNYFSQNNLSAWKLKYCLDNDTDRFAWADSIHGRGVIYYMKDEFNNEAPYDFKNIKISLNKVDVYTFGDNLNDLSITDANSNNNTIKPLLDDDRLFINMINISGKCVSVSFGQNCKNITVDCDCSNVQFGNGCISIYINNTEGLTDSVIFAGTQHIEIQERNGGVIRNCHVFSCDYKGELTKVNMANFSEPCIKISKNNGSISVTTI